MSLAKPGDFITTRCRRCDDVTGHVVMLVLDGVIAKVECKACGSVHKYYAPKPVKTKSTSSAVRHVRAGQGRETATDLGGKKTTSRTKTAAKIESAWQEAMVRHVAETPIPYSMKTPISSGMFIEHPSFGRGEVISAIKPDKAEILFQSGVKLLRCLVE